MLIKEQSDMALFSGEFLEIILTAPLTRNKLPRLSLRIQTQK